MLNRFDINLSGMSRDFFQDYSIFSNDDEDVGFTTEDTSKGTPATSLIGQTDDEEFNDCLNEGDYQDDDDDEEDQGDDEDSSEDGERVALAYDSSQLSEQTGPPQNGHDYLRLVEKESRALPSVFSAQKPVDRRRELSESDDKQSTSSTLSAESSHQSIDYVSMNAEETSYTPIKPSTVGLAAKLKTNNSDDSDDLRFRQDILNNFKRLREKIDAIRETKTAQSLREQEKISEKQIKKTMDRSVRQANSLIRLMELGHPPQVSTLITKSQLELHLTLEKLADQCSIAPNCSMTIHTDWIYSLIAALREPIEPDICSTLRRLARICIAKRKMYEEKAKAAAQSSSSKNCGGIPAPSCSSTNNNQGSINQPATMGEQTLAQPQSSSQPKKTSRKRQAGKAPENNEGLVQELEEEEYTSSLLIICIVRYYFGQVDLK